MTGAGQREPRAARRLHALSRRHERRPLGGQVHPRRRGRRHDAADGADEPRRRRPARVRSRSAGLRRPTTSRSPATTSTAARRAGFTPSTANRIGAADRHQLTPTQASRSAPTTTRSRPRTLPATSVRRRTRRTPRSPARARPRASSPRWGFDEGSGTTTADRSGNDNTGTLSAARPGRPRASSATHSPSTARTPSVSRRRLELARPDDRDDDRRTGSNPTRRRRLPNADRQGASRRPRLRPLLQQRHEPATVADHVSPPARTLGRHRHRADRALDAPRRDLRRHHPAPLRQRHSGCSGRRRRFDHDLDLAASDRRQLDLERVVQRADRRGADLQPRPHADRDPDRHEHLDQCAGLDPARARRAR